MAMNAEVRRTKARLAEDVVKLQKLAVKKVNSGSTMSRQDECLCSNFGLIAYCIHTGQRAYKRGTRIPL